MSRSTIERAFELARSGEISDVAHLKRRLKAERCRAVEALLAPRNIKRYLEALCLAAAKQPLTQQR
jgi:hypothetical protein